MRCIFTNRTIAIRCFSIGTTPTIGTNGDPSYHHQHQWSLFVSIGPPSSLFASPSENLIKVLPLRNKKVRGSYSNGNFFKLACSWALNGSPHSKKEKRRWFSPHSPTQQGREAWGRGYNRQDIRELKHQTFLILEWHGWPFRTGSGTRFPCQMQIIKQNNVTNADR